MDDTKPRLIRIDEAATRLGIGRSKAYQMVATGELPGLRRIGHVIRVSEPELDAYIRGNAPVAAGRDR